MPKMTNIELDEISIVDYPAHMVHGFAVVKSADPKSNRALASALRKEEMPTPEKTVAEVLAELSADDLRKALAPEVLSELATPAPEPTEEDLVKSLPEPVREMLAKRDRDLAEAQDKIAKSEQAEAIAKAAQLDSEAIAKSKETFTNLSFEHDVVAPALRKFAGEHPDAAEALDTMLKAVEAQADGTIFKELGSQAPAPASDDVDEQLNELAKSRASEKGIKFHKAYAEIVKEHPELVDAHFTSAPKEN